MSGAMGIALKHFFLLNLISFILFRPSLTIWQFSFVILHLNVISQVFNGYVVLLNVIK